MKIINGDPLTFENREYRVKIDWLDRVFYDQLTAYQDDVTYNQHANEDLGWSENLEQIVDESKNVDLSVRWFVYRGKSCDEKKSPMVICFDEYFETAWMRIADREGLIILSFEYHRNIRVPDEALGKPEFGVRNDEVEAYHIVIERVIKEQNVDKSRIYCNGISYGDMTALFYAKEHGDMLAGLVNNNGPASYYNIRKFDLENINAPLPVMHIRGEDDMSCDGYPAGLALDIAGNYAWQRNMRSRTSIINRNIWLKVNNVVSLMPEIYTCGKRLFLKYKTDTYPVIYNEIANNAHLTPVDYAEVMWEMVFSRFKKSECGAIVENTDTRWHKDETSCALAAGMSTAYIDHKLIDLGTKCIIIEPYEDLDEFSEFFAKPQVDYSSFYAPVNLLKHFFGIDYSVEDVSNHTNWLWGRENKEITLKDSVIRFKYNGKSYVMHSNSSLVLIDNYAYSLDRPILYVNDEMMVPVAEFSKMLGLYSSECNDAIYITDHEVKIGFTFSRLLREEILAEKSELGTKTHSVSIIDNEGGNVSVSKTTVNEGQEVVITALPADGYITRNVLAYINGLSVPVYQVGSNYYLYNVLGEVKVQGVFEKTGGC